MHSAKSDEATATKLLSPISTKRIVEKHIFGVNDGN